MMVMVVFVVIGNWVIALLTNEVTIYSCIMYTSGCGLLFGCIVGFPCLED